MEGPSLRDAKSSPNYPFPLLENPSSRRQNYQTGDQRLGFPGGAMAKNPLTNAREVGDMGSIPGLKRSSEEKTATQSSILVWKILWTEDPGWLQSLGSQRIGHD